MSFILEAIRERPEGLWLMDDATPLQDYSGFNRAGTLTGTLATHTPLVNGATYSSILSSTVTASFPTPIFQQAEEFKSFSLEAWVRPLAGAGPVAVLSHTGQYDGLTINGTKVAFSTKYLTTGEAKAEYDLGGLRRSHIVGVHTESKNSLYVNGELVAEVGITEAQQSDIYIPTTAFLYSGQSASGQKVAVNALAAHSVALTAESVLRHYRAGSGLPDPDSVVNFFRGARVPTDKTTSEVFLDQWWQTEDDWREGVLKNVAVSNDTLIPELLDGLTVAGTWLDIFNISSSDDTSLFGVVAEWEGSGVTVDASLDGTTWTPVANGKRISLITEGYNPTKKILQLRASFAAGQPADTAYLNRLNVTGYGSGNVRTSIGRVTTMTDAAPLPPFSITDMSDNSGIFVNGTLVIGTDTNPTANNPRTIELWIRRNGANPTISATGTTYQNGTAATTTLIEGAWTLVHIVTAAAVTSPITITGPAYIGHVGLYSTALTAAEIAEINKTYFRANSVRVDDSTLVDITQLPEAAEIYAYDWSIEAAG